MGSTTEKRKWLNSKEARKKLKVKSCDLMHLREEGKLEFKKEGNAFFYFITQGDKQN